MLLCARHSGSGRNFFPLPIRFLVYLGNNLTENGGIFVAFTVVYWFFFHKMCVVRVWVAGVPWEAD